MPRLILTLAVVLATTAVVAAPGNAAAEPAVGLQTDYGDNTDPAVEDAVRDELLDVFDTSSRYQWLAPEEGIEQLDVALQDCFERDCLQQIGDELDARLGLRVQFDVENEIYEWTVDFYDLDAGISLASEQATCELCGRAEVLQQFRASLQGNLVTLDPGDIRAEEPLETETDADSAQTEVRISVIPEDTRIFVDDDPVDTGQATLELEEGRYEVRFSHDTHRGLSEELIITEDSASLMVLRIHLADAGSEQRTVFTRGNGLVDQIEPHRSTIGWSAVGAGAALTVGSFFLAGAHGQPTCSDDIALRRCPTVYNTAGLATTTTIIGVTGLIGGAALLTWPWLAGETQDEPVEAGFDVAPAVHSDFTGLSIRGLF